MLRLLPVVLAASVAQPLINRLYAGPIYNWLTPHPTLLSIGQVFIARFVCLALSLLTVSILVLLALIVLKVPRLFFIVLCSTVALFSTTSASFVGLARYSRVSFYLLNAILYMSVYFIFYSIFVRTELSIKGKIGAGLAIAAFFYLCSSRLWYSLNSAFYRREMLSIVRDFDFTVYAPADPSGKVRLKDFVARKDVDWPAYLELFLNQEVDLYETRLTTVFNPPDDCGPFLPGLSLSMTYPCKKVFVTPKGREVYMRVYSGGKSKEYYFRVNATLITFKQRAIEPPALNLEEFVDSFEPTNAEGLQALLRSSLYTSRLGLCQKIVSFR